MKMSEIVKAAVDDISGAIGAFFAILVLIMLCGMLHHVLNLVPYGNEYSNLIDSARDIGIAAILIATSIPATLLAIIKYLKSF